MLKKIPQIKYITPLYSSVEKNIEYINDYIDSINEENIYVDISDINIIDSCRISTLCSAHHFLRFPEGKIYWKVTSDLVNCLNSSMNLGNSIYLNFS